MPSYCGCAALLCRPYGREKTHISPPAKSPEAADGTPSALSGTETDRSRKQVLRRNRTRTRDFLTRLEHAISLAAEQSKQRVKLQVVLLGTRNSGTLPWLSFAIGLDDYHAISNVEQFAEAVSRDLPLELDKDFTFDPLLHRFSGHDLPMIRMLQDAFENDYKSVFGTSHASSRDRFFTLNASRFASFLLFSGQLTDCTWQALQNAECQPIRVRSANLPVSLLLTRAPDPESVDAPYLLELLCQHNIQQLTASRNIYLVDDVFYLPPQDSIRLLEPILSAFNTANNQALSLTGSLRSWSSAGLMRKYRPSLPLATAVTFWKGFDLGTCQPFVRS